MPERDRTRPRTAFDVDSADVGRGAADPSAVPRSGRDRAGRQGARVALARLGAGRAGVRGSGRGALRSGQRRRDVERDGGPPARAPGHRPAAGRRGSSPLPDLPGVVSSRAGSRRATRLLRRGARDGNRGSRQCRRAHRPQDARAHARPSRWLSLPPARAPRPGGESRPARDRGRGARLRVVIRRRADRRGRRSHLLQLRPDQEHHLRGGRRDPHAGRRARGDIAPDA